MEMKLAIFGSVINVPLEAPGGVTDQSTQMDILTNLLKRSVHSLM